MEFFRRRPSGPPQLAPLVPVPSLEDQRRGVVVPANAGLWTEESLAALQRFLRDFYLTAEAGLPPGQFTGTPTEIEAGVDAETGNPALGWAPGLHRHHVSTEVAIGLANANTEGTAASLARSDHQHKRDVRVRLNGSDVGTRNALNLIDGGIVFTVADDAVGDEIEVSATAVDNDSRALAMLAIMGF